MPLLGQVLKKNPEQVKIVFKNYPIRKHKFARPAAIAAMAAHEQGKFWAFHDKLFKIYNLINDARIEEIAQGLGLDMARYEKDKKSPKILNAIRIDLQDAKKVGVKGTPTILINGKILRKRSLDGFQEMINAELARQ